MINSFRDALRDSDNDVLRQVSRSIITSVMTTETKPSEPAMRAASWIMNVILPVEPQSESIEAWTHKRDEVANLIDRETQLPQILEALEEAKEMGDHIDLFQGLPLNRIFVQTFEKLDALLAAHKQ